jgi:spermidine synthase
MKHFKETLYDSIAQEFRIDKLYFESTTGKQHLMIFHNAVLGRVMTLDGVVQTTEADEFIYHEMMAHVPIFAHGAAKRVLIIGGGDGGMLREVVRHAGVERIVQVEIDAKVVEMAKTYLPNHSQGAFDDDRVEIVIADGLEYVRDTAERFDVIISDSTDPIGPGEALFTENFYSHCKTLPGRGRRYGHSERRTVLPDRRDHHYAPPDGPAVRRSDVLRRGGADLPRWHHDVRVGYR